MNAPRHATPPLCRRRGTNALCLALSLSLSLSLGLSLSLVTAPAAAVPAHADPAAALLEAQRSAFRDAWPYAERGQWTRVEPALPLLEDYVLYPELRGAWLRATVARRSRDELLAFLDAHPEHPSSREVMLRWLSVLTSREDWAGYLEVYGRLGGSDSARLRCVAARAELVTGMREDWHARALDLWRVGVSQPDACDPVFARLRRDGHLDEYTIRGRLDLAIEARQFQLTRFLARSLPEQDRRRVARWEAMQRDPARGLAGYPQVPESADEWARVRYGLLVLAAREAERAFEHWQRLAPAYDRPDANEVGRRIALAGARRNRPEANTLLDSLPSAAVDLEVRHWRLRLALREQDWGGHSRAIATAARAELMDDLEIRYPLAWHQHFYETAAQAQLPSPWAIGVARNESLFVPDIASPAGAIGVMQLMPATGRQVARELQLPFQGLATLVDPDTNIRLGTRYLERMLERFDRHFVLATAAYNAGPSRVQRWLPEAALPADAWIELIPFDETRTYVHRVMASKAIFHWRLTGEELALGEIMRDVPPAGL